MAGKKATKKKKPKDIKTVLALLMRNNVSTIAELDSLVTIIEGGNVQSRIGEVRETRKLLFLAIKHNAGARRLLFKFMGEKK